MAQLWILTAKRSATRSHSSAGQAHFEAEPKKNMPSNLRLHPGAGPTPGQAILAGGYEVAPSSSALGPLQVLQPSAKTVHLVGELLNSTILLSPVCLTTVEKFPRRNMPDEEDFVILGIVLVGALHMAGFQAVFYGFGQIFWPDLYWHLQRKVTHLCGHWEWFSWLKGLGSRLTSY